MLFTNTIWPVLLEIMLGSRTGKYKETWLEIRARQAAEVDPHHHPLCYPTSLSFRQQGTEMEWFQEVTDPVLPRDQLTGTLLPDLHDHEYTS